MEQSSLATVRSIAPRKPGAIRRLEVLEAAAAILESQGPAALTVERVAQQVGIAKTTVYLYYESRESLVRAASERLLAACFEAADGAAISECPTRNVVEFCRALFRAAGELPPELVAGIGVDTGADSIDRFHAREFCGRLVARLAVLVERRGAPAVGARAAARTLVAAVLMQAQWRRRTELFGSVFDATDPLDETLRTVGVVA